jgi:hypothetical protein
VRPIIEFNHVNRVLPYDSVSLAALISLVLGLVGGILSIVVGLLVGLLGGVVDIILKLKLTATIKVLLLL